ncbi:FAD-binding oxidoreductase [Rhodospirillaceae bacterium KN72]|uniref:FAD-binding oxidoreductase n=1 Tax=Pacificispira spongiicola TaxID=2729598 RepID=A0A7Y0E247_9PROT|nr:FAD-binding oxidoreductase [Pacificispira spongiicola]NMM45850.1 FAD-binding oxidoreductase [Pacificispira spongiicola]
MNEQKVDGLGFSQSLWFATAIAAPDTPPLTDSRKADVAIVGGGFAGLSAALHLAERGVDVVVLEAKEPGWGASGRNGGQVIAGLKHDFADMVAAYGTDTAERMAAFADTTADAAFDLIARHGIDCDAVRGGWVQGAHADSALPEIDAMVERLSARGGDVAALNADEMERLLGTNWYKGGFLDRRAGTVQPLSLARGLAKAAIAVGAAVHGNSPVSGMARSAAGWVVTTEGGAAITADRVLMCTNGYSDLTGVQSAVARSVVPFFSYQIATRPLSENQLGALPAQGLGVSETRRVLSYCRVDKEGRFVMGARGALDGTLTDAAFSRPLERLQEIFPTLKGEEIVYRWNGKVAITPDHFPRIMEVAPGVGSALGWNGRGVAITTAMGPVLADWMTGTPASELPFPVTAPRPIPFHVFKRPASGVAVTWYNYLDNRERAKSAR